MHDLRQQLESSWSGRICFVGLGSPDYGDDAFGLHLADELIIEGVRHVLIAGTSPERFLGRILEGGFDHVVFLDAVEFGAEPGSMVVLNTREIAARFPQISTHKISLGILAKWIESEGNSLVWLLGVQPESIKVESSPTATTQKTLEIVRDLLLEIFARQEARAAESESEMELPV